jgi:lysophospholipase L1-like esterase
MPRTAWEWLMVLTVLGAAPLLAIRRRGADVVTLAVLVNLLSGCAFIALFPSADTPALAATALGLLAGNLALGVGPRRWGDRLVRNARTTPGKVAILALFVAFVPLGTLELTCRFLTDLGVLSYHEPIRTVWRAGHDEWRLATITASRVQEPDPVLLWRPAPRKPFNRQRFKGPEVVIPKPSGVYRIVCYGDSLTDGPPRGGWPTRLRALLQRPPGSSEPRLEVVNAGVAGYSSHQGVLRFLQEADRLQPDLVLVSFGWNDAADAIGGPDKSFRVPPWPVVALQRTLVRYRSYLVLMNYARSLRSAPPAPAVGPRQPRVAVEEYCANLGRFQAEAAARGIPVVFLTRPHRAGSAELARNSGWRGTVPRYNAALRSWALARKLPLIDVQDHFEHQPAGLFSDECHLTPQGYQRMAEFVRDRLAADIGRPLPQMTARRPPIGTAGPL